MLRICWVVWMAVALCGHFPSLALAADEAPEHGAQAEHGAGAHAVDPSATDPLSVDPDLAIYTAVVFVLLLIVLGKFAWGPIMEGLEKREQGIAANIDAAQRQHDEAKTLLMDYQRKLAHAADDVRKMLEEARRDAEHTRQQILAEAQQGAELERQRMLRDVRTATDQALKEISERSANLAVDLAGRIIKSEVRPEDHASLIREAMGQFQAREPSAN